MANTILSLSLYPKLVGADWCAVIARTTDNFASASLYYGPPGLQYTQYKAICSDHKGNVVMGGTLYPYPGAVPAETPTLFYSHDDGITWFASSGSLTQGVGRTNDTTGNFIATDCKGTWIAVTNSRDAALGTTNAQMNTPAVILRSQDNGETWDSVKVLNDGTEFYYLKGTRQWPPCRGVATDGDGVWCVACGLDIYRSDDYGSTWTKAQSLSYPTSARAEYYSLATDGNGIWLTTLPYGTVNYNDSEVWRSTDNGASWNRCFTFSGIADHGGVGLAATNKNGIWLLGAEYLYSDATTYIYMSTNNGTSWVGHYKYSESNASVGSMDVLGSVWVFVDSEPYLSTDGTASWSTVANPGGGLYSWEGVVLGALPCPPPEVHPGSGVVFV